MEILGRDSRREAYRVATSGPDGRIVGLIPDTLISQSRALTGGHGHQTAYEWIASNGQAIETALKARAGGTGKIRGPFDRIVLEEED